MDHDPLETLVTMAALLIYIILIALYIALATIDYRLSYNHKFD